MTHVDYLTNLIANYLNQVTAYSKKRYNPAALAQYNEIVAHVNAMATAGLWDAVNVLPDECFLVITNIEQVKTANLALYTVFMDNETDWGQTWPVPYGV